MYGCRNIYKLPRREVGRLKLFLLPLKQWVLDNPTRWKG